MALTEVQRARIILDLLKDGVVSNEATYNNVDMATAAIAAKYGQSVWDTFGPDVNGSGPILNPSNTQLASFFLKRLRVLLKQSLLHIRTSAAESAAKASEAATVNAETLAEIGE